MRNNQGEFARLVCIDPRLKTLENVSLTLAERTSPRKRLNAFYDKIKPSVCSMAGWDRKPRHEVLSSAEAYDIVYDHCVRIMDDTKYRKSITRSSP